MNTERQYRYWQTRLLISTIAGYALFYFVRKNLSVANARWFLPLGLALCALVNFAFGLSASVVAFGLLWMVAAFEISGILGMLSSGWLTDRVFGGRGARACLVYMGLCTGSLLLFWRLPGAPVAISAFLLCTAGFFIYGPQSLVGIAALCWPAKAHGYAEKERAHGA